MTTILKYVNLVEKHKGHVLTHVVQLTHDQFAAMLTDHAQQVIEAERKRLVDESGVMPRVVFSENQQAASADGTQDIIEVIEYCNAREVRKAITLLQAKYEHEQKAYEQHLGGLREALSAESAALQQSQARAEELEKRSEELYFLDDLLMWVERAVDKGNANSDIEEAYTRYDKWLQERALSKKVQL